MHPKYVCNATVSRMLPLAALIALWGLFPQHSRGSPSVASRDANIRRTQEGCGGLGEENPAAFPKAGPIFTAAINFPCWKMPKPWRGQNRCWGGFWRFSTVSKLGAL